MDDHIRILKRLKNRGENPEVIYDIGSCYGEWTDAAARVFPDAQYILFDAWDGTPRTPDYTGVLGNEDGKVVNFYQNDKLPWGNSYYREIATSEVFPESSAKSRIMRTLDSVVKEHGWPSPDLVKIDVQGAERDVIEGAYETFKDTRHIIVEMQHGDYNEGAPKYHTTGPWLEGLGWECIEWRFSSSSPYDADYLFRRKGLASNYAHDLSGRSVNS